MPPEWIGEIKVVLFDWGGTLCTTAKEFDVWPVGGLAAIRAARAAGVNVAEEHLASLIDRVNAARTRLEADPELRELDTAALLSEWLTSAGHADPSADALASIADAFWSCWVGCLQPIGPAGDLLCGLKKAGYRLGLVSNTATPPKWCRIELARLGLRHFFDGLTFSSEVGRRKPHPAIYQDALRRISVDGTLETRRVLFVGDSPISDVAGPQRMGMRTALVCDRTQARPAETLAALAPDLILDRATDLATLLPQPH